MSDATHGSGYAGEAIGNNCTTGHRDRDLESGSAWAKGKGGSGGRHEPARGFGIKRTDGRSTAQLGENS